MTRLVMVGICLSITAVLGTVLRIRAVDRRPAPDETDAAGDYGPIPIVTATGATIRLRVAAPNGGN